MSNLLLSFSTYTCYILKSILYPLPKKYAIEAKTKCLILGKRYTFLTAEGNYDKFQSTKCEFITV